MMKIIIIKLSVEFDENIIENIVVFDKIRIIKFHFIIKYKELPLNFNGNKSTPSELSHIEVYCFQ